MQSFKGLATKLNVDMTTVYRHYKQLCKDKGKTFTAHTTRKRGKILLDGHAQYMVINSFNQNHSNINEIASSIKIKAAEDRIDDLEATVKYQRKSINELHKEVDQAHIIADNAQKAYQRKISNTKPVGFLGWLKRHF